MKVKKILIIGFVSLALAVVGLFVKPGNGYDTPVIIKEKSLLARVVSKNADLQKGLGGQEKICGNCAMLFLFPKRGNYPFWMKDMKFPLDMIWIKDKTIVYIEKNVSQDYRGIVNPKLEADSVIEINAGTSDEYGITVGDKVEY